MSPVPKTPQYGDAARLEQLATGLKREHGTYGAVVQRNDAGRPTGSTGTPAPRASADLSVPPEHSSLMAEVARAEVVRQQWAAVAASSPTPWVQGMLEVANQNYEKLAAQLHGTTPNFEF